MNFVQARYYYRGGNTPKWVVIHDMEYPKRAGAAEWCANFFATSSPQSSAHYCIDPRSTVQSVKETDGAWHTPGFINGLEVNRNSIGIEHAGYANQSQAEWLDGDGKAMLEQSAKLVAEICERYDIPARHLTVEELRAGESGIVGHWDVTRASGTGDHIDPGEGFPWDWYINQVNVDMRGGFAKVSSALPLIMGLALLGAATLFVATTPASALRRIIPA